MHRFYANIETYIITALGTPNPIYIAHIIILMLLSTQYLVLLFKEQKKLTSLGIL